MLPQFTLSQAIPEVSFNRCTQVNMGWLMTILRVFLEFQFLPFDNSSVVTIRVHLSMYWFAVLATERYWMSLFIGTRFLFSYIHIRFLVCFLRFFQFFRQSCDSISSNVLFGVLYFFLQKKNENKKKNNDNKFQENG